MSTENHIPLRTFRNQLLQQIFTRPLADAQAFTIAPVRPVVNYPIRDLPVLYVPHVNLGTSTDIFLLGAELDSNVSYHLLDKQGNRVSELLTIERRLDSDPDWNVFTQHLATQNAVNWKVFLPGNPGDGLQHFIHELAREPDHPLAQTFRQQWKNLVHFTTPIIAEDTTFIIEAELAQHSITTSLLHRIRLQTSIKTDIEVRLIRQEAPAIPTATDIVEELEVNPSRSLLIRLETSQNNVFYQATNLADNTNLGISHPGDGGPIFLTIPANALSIDARLGVRAFRKFQTGLTFDVEPLEETVKIFIPITPTSFRFVPVVPASNQTILPNTAVANLVAQSLPGIQIDSPQPNVTYRLFAIQLRPGLSIDDTHANYASSGDLLAEMANIDLNDDSLEPVEIYTFGNDGTTPTNIQSELTEDSMLIIKAERSDTDSETQQWMTSRLVVRVRPLTDITIEDLSNDNHIRFRLPAAQMGVGYRILQHPPGADSFSATPATPMLYTQADRIGWEAHGHRFGMQIPPENASGAAGNYFKIKDTLTDAPSINNSLEFVIDPPTTSTVYRIEAIKEYTGLRTELSTTIDVNIPAP